MEDRSTGFSGPTPARVAENARRLVPKTCASGRDGFFGGILQHGRRPARGIGKPDDVVGEFDNRGLASAEVCSGRADLPLPAPLLDPCRSAARAGGVRLRVEDHRHRRGFADGATDQHGLLPRARGMYLAVHPSTNRPDIPPKAVPSPSGILANHRGGHGQPDSGSTTQIEPSPVTMGAPPGRRINPVASSIARTGTGAERLTSCSHSGGRLAA